MGMTREPVQERQITKEYTSNIQTVMPIERLLEAERRAECNDPPVPLERAVTNICQATNKQLIQLVEWAKLMPHLTSLPDGCNELLIAPFSYRSIQAQEGIVLPTGLTVNEQSAHAVKVGSKYDRVLSELVNKMKKMKMDETELGSIRAIILYNPGVRGLKSKQEVEILREKIYTHPNEPDRFAKLKLHLPALKSIGLKCLEYLFFFTLFGGGSVDVDTFLRKMIEKSSDS